MIDASEALTLILESACPLATTTVAIQRASGMAIAEKIVSTEKFDQSWYPGESVGTLVLVEQGGKTTATQTVLYDTKEARDAVLKSPMESGVEAGYQRLEKLLASFEGAR